MWGVKRVSDGYALVDKDCNVLLSCKVDNFKMKEKLFYLCDKHNLELINTIDKEYRAGYKDALIDTGMSSEFE